MSDFSQGPGWWQASDGKWYPPEQAPGAQPVPPVPGGVAPGTPGWSQWGQLADWPTRALSGTIDFVALGVLGNVVSRISWGLGSLIQLAGFVFALYNAYLNGSTGQSIGKRVAGTKVVAEADGQLIGGGMGIVRYFAHILDVIICCIGYLFPLWDAKRQTIADKVMKTLVITGQEKKTLGEAFKN